LPFLWSRLEVAEHVFDQDHRGIDDDAEVDGPNRQKIRVLSHQHEHDHGEEQRKRDIYADDDGAAQIAKENPLNEKNQ
jgi:hypothetical protein